MNDCAKSGCSSPAGAQTAVRFVSGVLSTPVGPVGRIDHDWSWRDRLGAIRVRLDIGRMDYAVPPGLYASGSPTGQSPVLVTANYKLTVDHLRRAIRGMDAWLLVLDTKGVNVWCAAGKGTFGTAELVDRIAVTRLAGLVGHRTLVLPQLGAPGIAAHEVHAASGFNVVYGPVRAADLPKFMKDGMRASAEMRTVSFHLGERLAVAPVEIVHWSKWLAAIMIVSAVAAAIGAGDYAPAHFVRSAARLLIAFAGGVILGPVFFPWLPGRAFAVKGAFSGLLALAIMLAAGLLPLRTATDTMQAAGWVLLTLGVSSFLMLAYTGASPYTSLSGTEQETRIGVRLQWTAGIAGLLLLILPALPVKG
ncbi:MAG: mercury methylation corrinoid protein HgcA [Victivallaceae bacterium]|nr:mercury methylation corrinoid protein HgcA [Victivallaceae bacterium]